MRTHIIRDDSFELIFERDTDIDSSIMIVTMKKDSNDLGTTMAVTKQELLDAIDKIEL